MSEPPGPKAHRGTALVLVAPELATDEVIDHVTAGLLEVGEVWVRPLTTPHGGNPASVSSSTDKPPELVVLAALDRQSLRRAVPALTNLGAARSVGCWLATSSPAALGLVHRRPWPPLHELRTQREPECLLLARFAAPADVRAVLLAVARHATADAHLASGWPVLGARPDEPHLWTPADPSAVIADDSVLADHTGDYPPDLTVTTSPLVVDGPCPDEPHHVLGRCPATHVVDPDGPTSLGPFDERILNPRGYHRASTGEPRPLRAVADSPGWFLIPGQGKQPDVHLDARYGLRESQIPRLRKLPGLRPEWGDLHAGEAPGTEYADTRTWARLVVGLAMAGVPVVADVLPERVGQLLHDDLANALTSTVDLTDPLRREEHSVQLRRAAHLRHSARGWRKALAAASGQQFSDFPPVSVLLCSRRPEQVRFALRQVMRQHRDAGSVDLELVLATHGFEPDHDDLVAFRERSDIALTVVPAPQDRLFGAVLNDAAARASGHVLLKMDDDDWYGPYFVLDLLLAREYSGADLVGTPPEFRFIEPLWTTTRGRAPSEGYQSPVAGGTMLVDRGAFATVGGFRETRRYVDRCLQEAVLNSGGRIFRSQGLGYVLRRTASGHTWDPGVDWFLDPSHVWDQWHGFRPSLLLEPDPHDVPQPPSTLPSRTSPPRHGG